jgi:hypothetical protein
MRDPFPLPTPSWLAKATTPLAKKLALPTLPIHAHEIIVAFAFYLWIQVKLSPWLSPKLFPKHYTKLSPRTKLNWDVHVVSFVQSVLICSLALYVMWADDERREMNWQGRVWGYTGSTGLIQSFGLGYFLWDLYITATNLSMFGVGMLMHAISALVVYSFGFVSVPTSLCHGASVLIVETATICKLLRSQLHPLRTLVSLPKHPLVL